MIRIILIVLSLLLLVIAFTFKKVGPAFFKQLGIENNKNAASGFMVILIFSALLAFSGSFYPTKTMALGITIAILILSFIFSVYLTMSMKK